MKEKERDEKEKKEEEEEERERREVYLHASARLRASIASRIAAKRLLRFRANDKKLSVMTRDTRPFPKERPCSGTRLESREYGRFYEKSNFDSRP